MLRLVGPVLRARRYDLGLFLGQQLPQHVPLFLVALVFEESAEATDILVVDETFHETPPGGVWTFREPLDSRLVGYTTQIQKGRHEIERATQHPPIRPLLISNQATEGRNRPAPMNERTLSA